MPRVPHFVYPYYMGGPEDGKRIPEGVIAGSRIRRGTIVVGDETYLRAVAGLWGNANLVYFVARTWDARDFHPAHAAQRVLASHPELREVTYKELHGEDHL